MAPNVVTPELSNVDYSYQGSRTQAATGKAYSAKVPAAERTAENREGRIIGFATLPYENSGMSYGIVAQYAPDSTESDPIIRVTSNYGGEKTVQDVHINEVNPRGATQLEMFALLSYTDDQGISNGGSFGSYHRMKIYAENAKMNGYWGGSADYEAFVSEKHDWQQIMISMWEEYSDAGIYTQMMNCIGLSETMEKFSIRFVDFDNTTFEDRSAEVSLRYTEPEPPWEDAAARSEAAAVYAKEQENAAPPDYLQMIKEYVQNLFVKIQNGDAEPSYQIGGRSFTVTEWEELLEEFDSVEEALRKLIEEEIQKRVEAQQSSKAAEAEEGAAAEEAAECAAAAESSEEAQTGGTDAAITMITADTVQARFPLQETDEDGSRKADVYLVAIDSTGIRCSAPGEDRYEWEIEFTDEEQYENASAFMDWAKEHMDNFLFSAHENFWNDFLGGNMDVDAFKSFLEGTDNGIPNYAVTVGDSMYVDRDKAQWAKYMNPLKGRFYTAEEFAKLVAEEIEKNSAKLTKLDAPYSETYKKYHPEYNGEAIFCEYPGGPLYTADEIGRLMYERVFGQRNASRNKG